MDYRSFDWLMENVKIRFNSWVPRLLQSGAISPGRTIYFRDAKNPLSIPFDFFIHELFHVYQRERHKEKLWTGFKWLANFYFHIRHRVEFIYYFFGVWNVWKAHDKISYEIEAHNESKLMTRGENSFYNHIMRRQE